MRGTARLLALAATICVAAAALADDGLVRDDAHHFRLERPAASIPLDADVVEELRARVSRVRKSVEGATGMECDWIGVATFGLPREGEDGPPSKVLVSFQGWSSQPRSYRGIEKRFSREMMSAYAAITAQLLAPATVPRPHDDVVVDRGRGRVTWHGTSTTADVGVVATYAVGLLGRDGVVWLNASARPAHAASTWSVVDGVADSFRWDDGYAFREEVAAGAGPTPWRDDAHRWSVLVPEGWSRRPPKAHHGKQCVSTFMLPDAGEPFDPEVLAVWVPAEFHRASWDEFERAVLGGELERTLTERGAFAVGGVATKIEWSPAVFDQHRGRWSATFSMDFSGIRWRGVLVNRFGRDGAAVLLCRALETDFAAAEPAFDALVDSLRFDDGSRWEDAFPLASIDWGSVAASGAVVVGIGALVAAVCWFFRARRARAAGERARARLLQPDPARRGSAARAAPPASPESPE